MVGLSIILIPLMSWAGFQNNNIYNDDYEFKTSPVAPITPPIKPPVKPPVVTPKIVAPVNPAPAAPVTPKPVVVAPPAEEIENPEVTSPYFEGPPPFMTPPAPANPPVVAPPTNNFNVNMKLTYPGTTYRGSQRAATMTTCGDLSFGTYKDCLPVNIAADFAPFVAKNIPTCVNVALKAAGSKEAATIFVDHYGAYQERKVDGSEKWSMHSTGRALDVAKFYIKTVDGKTVNVPMTIASKGKTFYETFNNCWTNMNAQRADCKNDSKFRNCKQDKNNLGKDCGTDAGTIDCRDSDHTTHVHLSMPFCPTKSTISST